jgi:hypothetical protein
MLDKQQPWCNDFLLCQLKEPFTFQFFCGLTGKIVLFDIFQFKKLYCVLDTKIVKYREILSTYRDIFFQ